MKKSNKIRKVWIVAIMSKLYFDHPILNLVFSVEFLHVLSEIVELLEGGPLNGATFNTRLVHLEYC